MRVTVFGGASPRPGEAAYAEALRLGQLLGEQGHTVLTGGYIGTMEAVSRGAAECGAHVIGVTCEEIETWRKIAPNPWVQEEMRFPTLRARLFALMENCDVAIALPGGIGTLAEISGMWSQMQVMAMPRRPLILVGPGWRETFMTFFTALDAYVSPADRALLTFAADVEEASVQVSTPYRVPDHQTTRLPDQKTKRLPDQKTKRPMSNDKLPTRSENYSEWYTQVVLRAEMADYAPVRGCMVVRPYGWSLWENIQQALDSRFKATGHTNAAFPLLIPMSFLEKEKAHVEGFSPELAVVTIGGGSELEEPLVVRPTSETIIGYMYAKWIKSYRDLPVLINQWGNVVRWEMRTRLFLRTLEFYWQEGHTAHATPEEAEAETRRMLDVYYDFAVNEAAVPVIRGVKSEREKFAGAVRSYTIEAMMGDTKALQSGTSHNLGQNFAKAFDIQYLDERNELQYAWTTSWGLSTRFVGAIIMTHGDDQGLILPPRLAPIQVVIVPIWKADEEHQQVSAMAQDVAARLRAAGLRVEVDDSDNKTPGWKFNYWEMKGVPLRIEIGPRDVAKRAVVLARRDVPGREGKVFGIPVDEVAAHTQKTLTDIQAALLQRATEFRDANIHDVRSYDELKEVIETGGWARGWWAGSSEEEARIKEETGATIRCIPLEQVEGRGNCFYTGRAAERVALFAKAY